jgi:hypothetical protein
VAVTISGTTGTIHINGTAVISSTMAVPRNINRTSNFIGRSNMDLDGTGGDPFLNGSVDDFRIYNRSLSAAEIDAQYRDNMT